MSTKKTENPVVEAVYSISRQVAAALNIGDAGKVDSFLGKIEKKTARNISGLEQNIKTIEFNLATKEEKLNEDLQDAKDELLDSYGAIEVDSIKTNQEQTDYIPTYLGNINSKKGAVKRIEDLIKAAKEEAQDQIDALNEQIKDAKEIVAEVTKKA